MFIKIALTLNLYSSVILMQHYSNTFLALFNLGVMLSQRAETNTLIHIKIVQRAYNKVLILINHFKRL